jgi:hypothetical protein
MRDTFEKRRKEQRRREKQKMKAEKREQRKSTAPVSPYSDDAIAPLEADAFLPARHPDSEN